MYETENFCLIDGSKMRWVNNGDSKHFYHCDLCGFEYWWLCTPEQRDEEAQKYRQYLQTLPAEEKDKFIKKINNQICSIPDNKELKGQAQEFYRQLKEENNEKRSGLEKSLRVFESMKDGS